MKYHIFIVLLCLVSLSIQARFQLNSRFLTTNQWTFSFSPYNSVYLDVIFDSNGKVYKSDNRTLF